MRFTVISLDGQTGRVYADDVVAGDEVRAFAKTAGKRPGTDLIAAIPTIVHVYYPCEDSQKCCAAVDYPNC